MLLFQRFSNHCLANAVEPMRAANDMLGRDYYRWRFVTLDGSAVMSSSGLPVMPNTRLRDHPGGRHLFVISSYDAPKIACQPTSRALIAAARRFEGLVGMDTGAWLMAHAGLLDNRPATIHWEELTAFSETFPDVVARRERYVMDGNRITCGGAMTAFDLVLELIAQTHGEALRLEVSNLFLHQTAEAPLGQSYRRTSSALVERAIALMTASLEAPLPIGQIARQLKTTQRTLTRAFLKDLGAPPSTVYKRLRLASAHRHAQHSGFSIAEIALRCGYADASAMTRAFRQEYGKSPSDVRAGA